MLLSDCEITKIVLNWATFRAIILLFTLVFCIFVDILIKG